MKITALRLATMTAASVAAGPALIPAPGTIYKLGDTRAVMIEGPSHEALELVEAK
jgi:hypothetical protein